MALGKIVPTFCLLCLSAFADAQLHFSAEADFVEEVTDGESLNTVSKGHACFDIRNNTLITEYSYPLRSTVRLTLSLATTLPNFFVTPRSSIAGTLSRVLTTYLPKAIQRGATAPPKG